MNGEVNKVCITQICEVLNQQSKLINLFSHIIEFLIANQEMATSLQHRNHNQADTLDLALKVRSDIDNKL